MPNQPSPRRIRISFPVAGATAYADLMEDDAPDTCGAIWDLMPLRVRAIHDIWSGHQVIAHLDNAVVLRPENVLTYLPIPGDIFYYRCEDACPEPHVFYCDCVIPGWCG